MSQRITNLFLQPRPFWVPNADVFIAASGDLIICFELSGIQPGGVELHTEGNRLRITGKRPSSGVATAQTVLVHEINAGPFETFMDLPPGFDLRRASSAYLNGTLRITVPAVLTAS